MNWKNDHAMFACMKQELFTAVVGDVLDQMGLLHQFLPPQVKPLRSDMVLAGRAMPVLEADVWGERVEHTHNELMRKPFGLMFEALDDLQSGEVYICTGASPRYALWGELMSTRAIRLGAAGAVVDGYSRDTQGILRLDFPTFSIGTYAQDQGPRGKVVDWRVPIEWAGVRIEPGDVIFGDRDGVLVIPQAAVTEAISRALEKVRGENLVRQALEDGMSTVDAFAQFGIM